MKAIHNTKTINMTKKEYDAIGKTSSAAFREYCSLKAVFTDYEIKVVSKRSDSFFKRLKFDFMENYIKNSKRENIDEILEKFEVMKSNSSTFKVKEWFLDTFPEIEQEIKERKAQVEKLLNEAKQSKIEYLSKVA